MRCDCNHLVCNKNKNKNCDCRYHRTMWNPPSSLKNPLFFFRIHSALWEKSIARSNVRLLFDEVLIKGMAKFSLLSAFSAESYWVKFFTMSQAFATEREPVSIVENSLQWFTDQMLLIHIRYHCEAFSSMI